MAPRKNKNSSVEDKLHKKQSKKMCTRATKVKYEDRMDIDTEQVSTY
jgi:hypothetical protein